MKNRPQQVYRWARLYTGCFLLIALISGCTMPPNLMRDHKPSVSPEYPRDTSLSGKAPIDSALLHRATSHPKSPEVVLLENGDDALLARIHLIRAARHSIDIQTYIWVYDRTGSWIFSELLEAARRGVKVRILVDQIVPPRISTEEYAAIANAHQNLELRLFRPLTKDAINATWKVYQNTFTRFNTLNRRMHNKVILIDQAMAIVGGRNYQDAYFDRDPTFNFIDRDVLVSGPVCSDISLSFEEFWSDPMVHEATKMRDLRSQIENGTLVWPEIMDAPLDPIFHEVDHLASQPDIQSVRDSLKSWKVESLQYLTDSPKKVSRFQNPLDQQNPFSPLIKCLYEANEEIILQTPYSIVGEKSYKLAKTIRKEKPDIRIRLISNSLSSSDHIYVGGIALKQRRSQIEDLKLELYLAKPVPADIREIVPRYDLLLDQSASKLSPDWENDPQIADLEIEGPRFCVHSKSLLIDRKLSFVGSHNFDPRSFNLNTECGILIDDPAFSRHLGALLDRSIRPRNSWVVAPRNFPPVVGEINGLVTMILSKLPMFDIWPLEHVTCFELNEGAEPVSPYDERFYQNYYDVGPIPGLNIGLRSVQAQIARAFAGLTTPLM